MIFAAEFWVAVSFFAFLAILGYFGVHRTILGALDARGDRIRAELDEARRLRDEAHKVLAEYRRKEHEAHEEAKAILASAKAEAERLVTEGKGKVDEFVARRTRMAELKIAQAEAQAMADVRAAAAEAAVKAAGTILAQEVKGPTAARLIEGGIGEVKVRLN